MVQDTGETWRRGLETEINYLARSRKEMQELAAHRQAWRESVEELCSNGWWQGRRDRLLQNRNKESGATIWKKKYTEVKANYVEK